MKPTTFNSIQCRTGNCNVLPDVWGQKAVNITDLDINDMEHPNVAPFKGTLLLLDEPSDQPPHGSDGHPIFVPKSVAERRLDTLPGMAINYQSDLEGHNPSEKIGVITKAWIDGNKVKVEGNIWKKDFPEALRTFRMNRGRLGMSMELGDVYVRDKDEATWHLEDFHFTGATVLKKDHAAYEATELAASKHFVNALAAARSAVSVITKKGGKPEMPEDKKKKQSSGQSASVLVAAISASVGKSVGDVLKDFQKKQDETNTRFAEALESISASNEAIVKGLSEMALGSVSASADDNADVIDAEVEDIEAGMSNPSDASASNPSMASAKSSDASDATDSSDATDATDASDVYSEVDTGNRAGQDDTGSGATPGNLNPDASSNYREQSKGPASSRIQKTGKSGDNRGIAASRERGTFVARSMAAAKVIRTLTIQNKDLKENNRRLQNRVSALEASVERYADRVERRTVSPEIMSLLEKGGHDVRELFASKQRLTVNEVDEMFAKSGVPLEPAMRAALKNQLLQVGLMENGEVRRYN